MADSSFGGTESTSKRTKTLNNAKDRSMTTNSSDLLLTVTATHRGAGKDARKEAFAHISRDASQAIIQAWMLQLSAKISRQVALLEALSIEPVQNSDDLAALEWIQRSLEDVEATIFALSEENRHRFAAFQGSAPSSAENPVP
jgi:hypothetical protein